MKREAEKQDDHAAAAVVLETPTVAERWQWYAETEVPEEARKAQIRATERAFYGGALALMDLLMGEAGRRWRSNNQGAELVRNLSIELKVFAKGQSS